MPSIFLIPGEFIAMPGTAMPLTDGVDTNLDAVKAAISDAGYDVTAGAAV